MPRRTPGFTLIELLVVIAVIAVVASLLFPVFAAAKEKGRTATCQSNLRQIWMAFELYLQDWDGAYPNVGDPFLWMGRKWRWPLKHYLGLAAEPDPGNPWGSTRSRPGILLCPADSVAPREWDSTSYAYSMAFYHTPEQINSMTRIEQTWADRPGCVTQSQSGVTSPAQKALVGEWLSNHESPHVGWNSWEGGRSYLFADGHCTYLKAGQMKPANDGWPDINLTRDGIGGKDID